MSSNDDHPAEATAGLPSTPDALTMVGGTGAQLLQRARQASRNARQAVQTQTIRLLTPRASTLLTGGVVPAAVDAGTEVNVTEDEDEEEDVEPESGNDDSNDPPYDGSSPSDTSGPMLSPIKTRSSKPIPDAKTPTSRKSWADMDEEDDDDDDAIEDDSPSKVAATNVAKAIQDQLGKDDPELTRRIISKIAYNEGRKAAKHPIPPSSDGTSKRGLDGDSNFDGAGGDDDDPDPYESFYTKTPTPFDLLMTALDMNDTKICFIRDNLGITDMEALYATAEDDWNNIASRPSREVPLNYSDIRRLKGIHRWAVGFTTDGVPEEPPSNFTTYNNVYGTRQLDRFLTLELKRSHGETAAPGLKYDSNDSPDGNKDKLTSFAVAEMIKMREEDRERAAEKAERDRAERAARDLRSSYDKPSVSAYPSIPGKKWLTTKKSFLAIAKSQGLGHTLDPEHVLDTNDEASMRKYENDCAFMKSVLEHATARGETAWVATRDPDAASYEIWGKIIEWEEKSGKQEQRAIKANRFIATERFTATYSGGFKAYINKFFESLRELEELGQPVTDAMATTYLLNNMAATETQPTVQTCRINNYGLEQTVSLLRQTVLHLGMGSREDRNVGNTTTNSARSSGSNPLMRYLNSQERVPDDVWSSASRDQRQEFSRRRRDNRRNQNRQQPDRRSQPHQGSSHDNNQGRRPRSGLPNHVWQQLSPENRQAIL